MLAGCVAIWRYSPFPHCAQHVSRWGYVVIQPLLLPNGQMGAEGRSWGNGHMSLGGEASASFPNVTRFLVFNTNKPFFKAIGCQEIWEFKISRTSIPSHESQSHFFSSTRALIWCSRPSLEGSGPLWSPTTFPSVLGLVSGFSVLPLEMRSSAILPRKPSGSRT